MSFLLDLHLFLGRPVKLSHENMSKGMSCIEYVMIPVNISISMWLYYNKKEMVSLSLNSKRLLKGDVRSNFYHTFFLSNWKAFFLTITKIYILSIICLFNTEIQRIKIFLLLPWLQNL